MKKIKLYWRPYDSNGDLIDDSIMVFDNGDDWNIETEGVGHYLGCQVAIIPFCSPISRLWAESIAEQICMSNINTRNLVEIPECFDDDEDYDA